MTALARLPSIVFVAAALLPATIHATQPANAVPRVRGETLVVMPFANISGAEADRWIGAGIAETLASDLPGLAGIEILDRDVFSRAQTRETARGEPVGDEGEALEVSRELGATWFIGGSYQRVGERLRIIARLVPTQTGTVAYTVKVDGSLEELFALQDRVVEALGVQLRTGREPSRRVEGTNIDRVGQPGSVSSRVRPLPGAPPVAPVASGSAPSSTLEPRRG